MSRLQAWQHIYSNVEKAQSPQGRGGFQTLFYTKEGLTEAEVEELEGRLLYFASETTPVKRVFFTLTTDKRVISQLVPLSETDQYGRKGRYLAHSLIFNAQTFAGLDENPFPLLQRVKFITTIEAALAQGDFASGHISTLAVSSPPYSYHAVELAAGWSRSELKKLTLLALRSAKMAQEKRAVAFFGPPEAVEAALETAFFAVPNSMRSSCSFDTYFHRCNLVATYYWAVGFPERSGNPTYDRVDARTKEVLQINDDQAQTAYERWVHHSIDIGSLRPVTTLRDAALPLCQWLDSGATEHRLLNGLDPDIVTPVFRANSEPVQALLRQKIGRHVPMALIDPIFDHIYRESETKPNFQFLREGFTHVQIMDYLHQIYAHHDFQRPDHLQLQALERALQNGDAHPLKPIQLAWSQDRSGLRRHLSQLEEPAYREFAQMALPRQLCEPIDLLVANHESAFLDIFLVDKQAKQTPLTDFIEGLLALNKPNLLTRLAGLITYQTDKDLRRIAKLASRQEDLPPLFDQALTKALDRLPDTVMERLAKSITSPLDIFRGKK